MRHVEYLLEALGGWAVPISGAGAGAMVRELEAELEALRAEANERNER
jgi:hypothetical protein